jgi:DNA end-binding protein Ku
MAARSIWNGALTIAGVNVPVKVFSATDSKTPHFRELHEKDGAPIEHKRVSSKTGREVAYDNIVKGYETSAGRYVVLTDDEIKAVEAPERRAIEVDDFVPADQIDPVFYDRAYFLGAQDDGRDAFAALLTALEKTDLVGIGRVVLRTKEQLVAIRPGDGCMRMSTMRFADELVDAGDLDITEPSKKPAKREIDMAAKLTKGLAKKFNAGSYKDTWRKTVEDYAKKKAAGKEPELPEPEPQEESDDLLAALEASMNGGGKKKSSSNGGSTTRKKKAKR